jgi:hypothetical protein
MTRLRWLGYAAVLSAVMAFVAGCSSPKEKIELCARTAGSWSATARRTSDALARGAVPRVYARQVLQEAIEGKRQLSEQPEWLSLPRNTRGQLENEIRQLASSLDERADSASRQ